MKRILSLSLLLIAVSAVSLAQAVNVTSFRYAGPYALQTPYMVDTVNVDGSKFEVKSLLRTNLSVEALRTAAYVSAVPASDEDALHLIGFTSQNFLYTKADVKVEGLKDWFLTMDGKEVSGKVKMEPGTHEFVLRFLGKDADSLKISLTPDKEGKISLREDGRRIYSLDINSMGAGHGGVSISADGKYICLGHKMTLPDGKANTYYEILRAADGKFVTRTSERISWMPTGSAYWYTRKGLEGRSLICADPETGVEKVLGTGIPEGWFTISPAGDFLLFNLRTDGPKEGEVHQILTPDDRQTGWRDRGYIARYDLATGLMQPLTYGWHNAWLCDISADGSKMLFSTSRERLTKRPSSLSSLYVMDLKTLEVNCIMEDEGFTGSYSFSPDASQVLVTGGPDSFDGIGRDVLEGQIPNQYDVQAYLINVADKSVKPLTKDFAPSVDNAVWSRADGKIYLSVEDKDCKSLYRLDPQSLKTEKLDGGEDYIPSFDLAPDANMLVYCGQSLENSDRAYKYDTKKGRRTLLYDFSAERLGGVDMGKGDAYEFTSSRGDLINGFYVLPPDFDPNKKYPLLVHYYGGCSPSSRYCVGAYSPQVYAAQGYVFYVINPSGAAGFGQEFAARHVNTAGDVVSDDIIEGTRRFCEDHPYIDTTKIGCFSASYGGFMTQLLLTKTDLYATGISHAGISDHTSYWGEGYWGYSYSQVSMADSYPWTRRDLYVDRSPLYNADKIHTPLLFLHGSADTNVPIGESIQMFTALKLLGAETAFVVVDGENHGVYDYAKRRQWLRTIFAWFSKYLQDDDTWWNELYPQKNL